MYRVVGLVTISHNVSMKAAYLTQQNQYHYMVFQPIGHLNNHHISGYNVAIQYNLLNPSLKDIITLAS